MSGLILALLGRPPRVGDAVEYDRVRLEVTSTSGHGVRQARAMLLPPPVPVMTRGLARWSAMAAGLLAPPPSLAAPDSAGADLGTRSGHVRSHPCGRRTICIGT